MDRKKRSHDLITMETHSEVTDLHFTQQHNKVKSASIKMLFDKIQLGSIIKAEILFCFEQLLDCFFLFSKCLLRLFLHKEFT